MTRRRPRRPNAADALATAARRKGPAREAWLRALGAEDPTLEAQVRRLLPYADDRAERGTPSIFAGQAVRPPAAEIGRVIGRRWRLVGLLGVGSAGAVYETEDAETGRRAALKLVHGLSGARRLAMRREASYLRWLRLPGVAQLIDDGSDGSAVFCVTEIVRGVAFPGAGHRETWAKLEPVALRLLGTVGAMHAAGVIHRDLKPANVLVDSAGVPTVLDLGISADAAPGARRAPHDESGTPAYSAPEQLRGEHVDARADLYAVGVMLFEALAGRRPGPRFRTQCRVLAAPPRVRELIASMLAPDRSRRPRDAWDALDFLHPPPPVRRGPRWTETALRERFHGPDRILHLREDAAAEVFRRTGGRRAAVERELRSFVRSGFAIDDGGLLRVTRDSLERLRTLAAADPRAGAADPIDLDLAHALRSRKPAEVVRAAIRAARRRVRDGRMRAALAAAFEGAVAARTVGQPRQEERVLALACHAALRTNSPAEFDRALLALQRASADSANVRDLETTMRAAIDGALQRESDRLAAVIAVCRTNRSEDVLRVAWPVRNLLSQARGLDDERRSVRAIRRWLQRGGTAGARSILATVTAFIRYREARYADGLRLHLEAARYASDRGGRTQSLLHAATAAIEGGLPSARTLTRRAARCAATLREPTLEYSAEFLQRCAALRAATADGPDVELVDIVSTFELGSVVAVAAVTEAAIAWRTGHVDAARSLALRAAERWGAGRFAIFARALAGAAGESIPRPEIRRIATLAPGLPPLVAAQTLALLAVANPRMRPLLRRAFLGLRLPADASDSARIREVLTLDEVHAALEF
ncbi:MAG: serine/threonine protein kinase [Planctomycetes bacterium]|nr:serine/threonine protein kinase [Planctomycetota bacterium]